MKILVACCFASVLLCSCHHEHSPYNPYLHSKHKPSQEIKGGYIKQDHWFRKKKNIQKVYFDKKN